MGLHIKYRPTDLHEIIGNKNTIAALEAAINSNNPPHTYLYTGPSGCGKTTLARISARMLGCVDNDIMEMNAANFRGIDTARDIIQQMRLAPLMGNAKAWIIDEVHATTKDMQGALLKALEDTPKHVYFLLATTDPQKLLPTLKNRCMIFPMQSLSEDRILDLLEDVLEKEQKKIKIPDEVLDQIAINSLGSPRSALILLDKIIDLPEKKMLKAANQIEETKQTTIDLCRALINGSKWKTIAKILNELQDTEPEQIRMSVLGYCKSILLKGENDKAFLIMDSFKEPFYNTGFAGLVRACYEVLFK